MGKNPSPTAFQEQESITGKLPLITSQKEHSVESVGAVTGAIEAVPCVTAVKTAGGACERKELVWRLGLTLWVKEICDAVMLRNNQGVQTTFSSVRSHLRWPTGAVGTIIPCKKFGAMSRSDKPLDKVVGV